MIDVHSIDTRVGTDSQRRFSNGNTLPLTGVPFGMNYISVQTTSDKESWYFNPRDRSFEGFRVTHQPSPWIDEFQQLLLTPISGDHFEGDEDSFWSSYRPEEATFSPSQIKIEQLRYEIQNKVTASTYGFVLNSLYLGPFQPGLILSSPGPSFWKVNQKDQIIEGYTSNFDGSRDKNFKMYVAIHVDSPLLEDSNDFHHSLKKHQEFKGNNQKLVLYFKNKEVTTHIATSFISPEQAMLNLKRQMADDFDKILEKANDKWENYLSKIEVTDRNKKKESVFYHNFYRTALFPMKFYELDESNQKVHYDTTNKKVKNGPFYTNNGFWDTFRTLYPLFSIIQPKEYHEMLEGYLNFYHETGFLPKWLSPDERGMMPGVLIDAVIADAAVKGIADDLLPELYQAMIKTATTQSKESRYGRRGVEDLEKYGYIPNDHRESVNHTLDYAYSDFCISEVAKKAGDLETAKKYLATSMNYKNLFDKNYGLMRGKDRNGEFKKEFLPEEWGWDYTEGSAWQNSFGVQHDINGLINEYGGKKEFLKKIVDLANQRPVYKVRKDHIEIHEMSEVAAIEYGQIGISDQPSFHLPYLYVYADAPEMTQVVIKQMVERLFTDKFDGYPGDEDNGSMSAWYIFSTLGFYPVTPGVGEYVFGIPYFDKAVIHLENKKDIVLKTNANYPQNNFVKDIVVDGKAYSKLFINHDTLMKGTEVDFTLGLVPALREIKDSDRPFSVSKLEKE